MERASNVKSIAAMFNPPPPPMEKNSPGPPSLKSIQERRAAFGAPSNSPSGITPTKPAGPKPVLGHKAPPPEAKPSFGKPSGVINRTPNSLRTRKEETDEITFPKPSALKSNNQQSEEQKPQFPKPLTAKPFLNSSTSQEPKFGGVKPKFPPEPKENPPAFPKPFQIKTSASGTENEIKTPFEKKPPFASKPPVNIGASPSENIKHGLATRTFSSSQEVKPIKATEENVSSSQTFHGVALRPTTNKQVQSPFLNNQKTDEANDSSKANFKSNMFLTKNNQEGNNSSPPAPNFPKKPSFGQNNQKEQDSSEPRQKLLKSVVQLGPAPPKPARPPYVDIERFRAGKGNKVAVSEQRSSALSSALPPPPPLPATKSVPPAPASSSLPSLPRRNIKLPSEPPNKSEEDHDENYDDVEIEGSKINDISEETEEFYEGIEEHSVQYKKEQEEKNDKKRKKELEQAKKEQREKEKKEQEMRKKFKLKDKVEALHQAKASTDYKGGKNELSFKTGEHIEIIRVTDNPEGKWLGRMNGIYGYIRTTMVNIDYGSLPKNQASPAHIPIKPAPDQEIYDDVGEQDSVSSASGNSFFPAPPSNDDIYDGVDEEPHDNSILQEEEKNSPWSWFKKRKGTEVIKRNVQEKSEPEDGEESEFALSHSSKPGEELYDDVATSTDFPPPPLETDLKVRSNTLGKSADNKTLKKQEREEKDFRKKFKFTGEIRVLSSVQVLPCLTTKKWGSKDLPLKPREMLEVIQHTNDSTLLCRNKEGKYGYVSRSNIVEHDGDIYDDVGEDCIYDND